MAWNRDLIMTEKRIKQRKAEKKYRETHKLNQANRTPEQQERCRQIWRKYNNSNKEKLSLKAKKYYIKNRDRILNKSKEYRKDNPEVALRSGEKYLKKLGVGMGISTKNVKRVLLSWKRTVQKRDKVCQICGSENNLQAHHILYRKYYPKLALNINNGMLLCKTHHNETHGWCLN